MHGVVKVLDGGRFGGYMRGKVDEDVVQISMVLQIEVLSRFWEMGVLGISSGGG